MRSFPRTAALLSTLTVATITGAQDIPFRTMGDFYVTDRTNDEVYRFTDANGDGDVQDAGEQTVFYDASSPGPDLSNPQALTVDPATGDLIVADATLDIVLRLRDRNGDGDANDANEYSVIYDNTGAIPLGAVNALCFDGSGALFLCVAGQGSAPADQILRLVDGNADGDMLDAGEATVYLDNSAASGAWLAVPAAMTIRRGALYVADLNASPDSILRIEDLNNDGDALDAGEAKRWAAPKAAGANSMWSLEFDFFSDALYGMGLTTDNVYRFEDKDRDGDALDSGEATVWFDSANNASNVAIGTSFSLTTVPTALGVVYVSDHSNDIVYRMQDVNLDGDANDAGEVTVYAQNTGTPPLARPLGTLRDCVFAPAGVLVAAQVEPSIGTVASWGIDDAIGAGLPYAASISLGNSGIPLPSPDVRTIPLSPDPLFGLALTGQLPLLQGGVGTLDANGQSALILTIPNAPGLIAVTLHLAFVTLDPQSPSGVRTVSRPQSATIAP